MVQQSYDGETGKSLFEINFSLSFPLWDRFEKKNQRSSSTQSKMPHRPPSLGRRQLPQDKFTPPMWPLLLLLIKAFLSLSSSSWVTLTVCCGALTEWRKTSRCDSSRSSAESFLSCLCPLCLRGNRATSFLLSFPTQTCLQIAHICQTR